MNLGTLVTRLYIVDQLRSHSDYDPADALSQHSAGELWQTFKGALQGRSKADIRANIDLARGPGYEQRTLDQSVQQYYRTSLDLLGMAHTQVLEWQDKYVRLGGRVLEIGLRLKNIYDSEERSRMIAKREVFEGERVSARRNGGAIVTAAVNHVHTIVQRQGQDPFVRFPAHFQAYNAAARTAIEQINRLYDDRYGRP